MNISSLTSQLEEFNLIKYSLLPDEAFTFGTNELEADDDKENETWNNLLAAHTGGILDLSSIATHGQREYDQSSKSIISSEPPWPSSPASFRITIESASIDIKVDVPLSYSGSSSSSNSGSDLAGINSDVSATNVTTTNAAAAATAQVSQRPVFTIRGDQISRADHDHWIRWTQQTLEEIGETEYPIHQLLTTLLPLLREEYEPQPLPTSADLSAPPTTNNRPTPKISNSQHNQQWHALLTSHHLISPNKRRSLQSWSSSLSISGFAKIGYPGVIYAQGWKEDVEEFVGNVKGMQWLALRVRFVEELPLLVSLDGEGEEGTRKWTEFQKVGEVVQEMKRLGRERFVVDMGIGAAGTK